MRPMPMPMPPPLPSWPAAAADLLRGRPDCEPELALLGPLRSLLSCRWGRVCVHVCVGGCACVRACVCV